MRFHFPTKTELERQQAKLSTLYSYGSDINAPPGKGCTRIAFQNARGISHGKHPAMNVIDSADEYGISIFGVAETNRTIDESMATDITAQAQKRFGNGLITHATMEGSKPGYNPGGVMQLTRGSAVGRKHLTWSDRYGRITMTTYTGKNEKELAIITAYRVSQKKGTPPRVPECKTAYWQQVTQFTKEGISDPDPRNQVLADLTKVIAMHRDKGREIIVMLDANESTTESNSGIAKFLDRNSLIDVHDETLAVKPITTRIGSRHVIDYIAVSEGALEFIREAGVCAAHEGLASDHVMLWIDFDMTSFFGSGAPKHMPPQAREFNCSNTRMRDTFLKELKAIFRKCNVLDRIDRLNEEFATNGKSRERVKQYNRIDRDIVQSAKAAVKRTVKRKQFGYARSPILVSTGRKVLFWKIVLSLHRHALTLSERTISLAKDLDIDITAGSSSRRDIEAKIRESWSELKEVQANAEEIRAKWLESLATYKAAADGDEDSSKVLKSMAQTIRDRGRCTEHCQAWLTDRVQGWTTSKCPPRSGTILPMQTNCTGTTMEYSKHTHPMPTHRQRFTRITASKSSPTMPSK